MIHISELALLAGYIILDLYIAYFQFNVHPVVFSPILNLK